MGDRSKIIPTNKNKQMKSLSGVRGDMRRIIYEQKQRPGI